MPLRELPTWCRRAFDPEHRLTVLGAGLAVVGLCALGWSAWPAGPRGSSTVPLSTAVQEVRSSHVREAVLGSGGRSVLLTMDDDRSVAADVPAGYGAQLTQILLDAHVPTRAEDATSARTAARLVAVLTLLAAAGLLMRPRGGTLLRGRRRPAAGSRAVPVPRTRFAQVAGCPEAVQDLREVAGFLREPERYTAGGARLPRGYLLTGPPGTGKTLLARAVAGEAGLPFFATSGADFNDQYVGVGARRIRALFTAARDAARRHGGAVLFVDEIDAVGGHRAGGRTDSAGSDHDATLVALLTELDGFDDRGRIVVLAATNRPDALDEALRRPGRFDRTIAVAAPDPRGRAAILAVHAARITTTDDVDLTSLARRTPGFVGADLESLVNEAALEAGRRGRVAADPDCFEEALATAALGRARTGALVTDRDRQITAWHEAGHTVLALVEPEADDPVSVTIVPRGAAGGVTWMSGHDDAFLTVGQARAQLAVAMGGRAAEEVLLGGTFTQGAAGDLRAATGLGTRMATEFGMTRLGLVWRPVDGELPAAVQEVVAELLDQALDRARTRLRQHAGLLTALAARLLAEETLRSRELEQLWREHRVMDPRLDEAPVRVPLPRVPALG